MSVYKHLNSILQSYSNAVKKEAQIEKLKQVFFNNTKQYTCNRTQYYITIS